MIVRERNTVNELLLECALMLQLDVRHLCLVFADCDIHKQSATLEDVGMVEGAEFSVIVKPDLTRWPQISCVAISIAVSLLVIPSVLFMAPDCNSGFLRRGDDSVDCRVRLAGSCVWLSYIIIACPIFFHHLCYLCSTSP
jgi:hypothetical protein